MAISAVSYDEYVKSYIASRGMPVVESQIIKYSNDPTIRERYGDYIKFRSGFNMGDIVDDFHRKVPYKFASVMKLLESNVRASNGDYSKSNDAILLIPHSQGNLYANSLYLYLTGAQGFFEKHVAIFGVASPAEQNYGDWWVSRGRIELNKYLGNYPIYPYITSDGDKVINSLRISNPIILSVLKFITSFKVSAFNGIASSTSSPPSGTSDLLSHSLTDYYLTQPDLRQFTINGINAAAYVLDEELMDSMLYNTVSYNNGSANINRKYKPYNYYPQVFTLMFGYNIYTPQILAYWKFNGRLNDFTLIWDRSYDFEENPNEFISLRTPVLDNVAKVSNASTDARYPAVIYHRAAMLNANYFDKGYPSNASTYYIYEDINDESNPVHYKLIMYPYMELGSSGGVYNVQYKSYPYFTYNAYYKQTICYFSSEGYSWAWAYLTSFRNIRDNADLFFPQIGMEGNRLLLKDNPRYAETKSCLAIEASRSSNLVNDKYIPDAFFYIQ